MSQWTECDLKVVGVFFLHLIRYGIYVKNVKLCIFFCVEQRAFH